MDHPESRRDAGDDPYRWLEDPDAPETSRWVRAQNAVTEDHLAALPDRAWFRATMDRVVRRPRAGVPFARGGRYVVTRNDGTQDQDVWYVADSLDELTAGGRVLIDPNTLSAAGTRALTSFSVTGDGSRAAYGLSDAGSDWATFFLIDLATGAEIADAAVTTKFSEAAWLPDGRSYAYTHFAAGVGADGTETLALPRPTLRIHRVGEPSEDDEEVLAFSDDDTLMMFAAMTDDDRFLAVSIVAGTDPRNRLWLYPLETGTDGASRLGPAIKVVDEPVAEFSVVASDGHTVVVQTDLDAERGRLVTVDLDRLAATGRPDWVELVPERADTLLTVVAVRDGFVAAYLADAQPELRRLDRSGRDLGPVPLSGGALVGLNVQPDSSECFVGLSSVTAPTRSWRLDTATGELTALPDPDARSASDDRPAGGVGGRPPTRARVLVMGWGSTSGPIVAAVRRVRKTGRQVAYTHLRHLNPFPANLGEILRAYDRVIVPEMNLGQLAMLLRAKYLVDVQSYSRVRGLPISLSELAADLETEIDTLENAREGVPV